MSVSVVLSMLLAAPAGSGAAPPPPAAACQSFSRDAQAMPPLAREWFAHSADERVLICPRSAAGAQGSEAAAYFGEGAVRERAGVCSYLSHGLTLVGSGTAARLERYERSEALDMALAGTGCPAPHGDALAAPYVKTYDVSSDAFIGIMRLWSAATAALAAGKEQCCAIGADAHASASAAAHPGAAAQPRAAESRIAPEARARIDAEIGPGHIGAARVTRIVRIPGSVLRHRYALFLTVPDATSGSPAVYVAYIDKSVRRPYEITDFAETN
ncbi:MAG TPA: hypothetical protein VKB20_07050 [Steroidobacteraceae bacterium]|nr:hypothetical protein [Steroidobacteraceae bacterium]